MEKEQEKSTAQFWRDAIKKHWKIMILAIIAIVSLCVVAVWVFIWHIETSFIGDFGKATFNEWSLDWVVRFMIVLILWELLFVGIPAGLIFGLGGYIWWKGLPQDEKSMFKKQETKSNKRKGAGGFGIVIFIFYCIYIALDGNYTAPFGSQHYSYWVYSYILTVLWILLIAGIPAVIVGLYYLKKWLNKAE